MNPILPMTSEERHANYLRRVWQTLTDAQKDLNNEGISTTHIILKLLESLSSQERETLQFLLFPVAPSKLDLLDVRHK